MKVAAAAFVRVGPRRRWVAPLIVGVSATAVAVLFIWPLLHVYWYQTHDMVAYPVRVIEYVAGWRAGALWPRWAYDLYGGFGCAFFNYYAPGLFIVSGIFLLLGASAAAALKIAVALFTAIGGIGVFGAVYGESRRRDAAAVAAVVFVFMPYHTTLVYVRGDLAEYCAVCLAPCAIWAYRALGRVPRRELLPVGLAAAACHAATLLVHTLTGQWLTEILLLIGGMSAWSAWRRGDRARVAAIALVFVGGCAATTIYALPALLDRPLVHIERMTEGGLATTRNFIEWAWLKAPGFFYAGKPILLLPVGIVAVVAFRRRIVRDVALWASLVAAMLLLMMSISRPLWSVLPFGTYIQFPWRLLGLTSLFAALAWGAIWRELVPANALVAWPLAIVAAAAVVYDGGRNLPPLAPMTETQVPTTPLDIAHGIHTTVISDEYLPKTLRVKIDKPEPRFVLGSSGAAIDSVLRSGTGYKVEVHADANATIDLRAIWFPGWKVNAIDRSPDAVVEPSPVGYVRVRMPSAGHYRLMVHFGLTWLRAVATAISLASVLALALLLARQRRVPPARWWRLGE